MTEQVREQVHVADPRPPDAGAERDRRLVAELQAEAERREGRIADLEEALGSARDIGAAVGIVMAANRCSQGDAFATLVRASQNSNRKLREVADEVVLRGELP